MLIMQLISNIPEKSKKKKNQPTDLTDYGQPVVEKILAYGFFLKTSLYKNKTM